MMCHLWRWVFQTWQEIEHVPRCALCSLEINTGVEKRCKTLKCIDKESMENWAGLMARVQGNQIQKFRKGFLAEMSCEPTSEIWVENGYGERRGQSHSSWKQEKMQKSWGREGQIMTEQGWLVLPLESEERGKLVPRETWGHESGKLTTHI